MSGLDTPAVANALLTRLQALPGLGAAQIGVPESIGKQVQAFLTMGSQPMVKKTTGSVQRTAHFFITFAYRVDDNETGAETALMGLVDAFQVVLNADLTLGGVSTGIEIDTGLADAPDYRSIAGKEFREYPFIITARQSGAFTPNP